MRVAREKSEHVGYRPWQRAFAGNLLCEFLQLLRVRQLSIEQQISDLLESGLFGHPMNVVAPIHQPGSGIDPADRRFTGDYPGQSRAVLWFCFSTHVVSLIVTTIRAPTNRQSLKPNHFSAVGS